jgi:hypothetical protein
MSTPTRNGQARAAGPPSVFTVMKSVDARWAQRHGQDPSLDERLRYVARFVTVAWLQKAARLERELNDLRQANQHLRSLEVSNEELRLAAEELRSANDWLELYLNEAKSTQARLEGEVDKLTAERDEHEQLRQLLTAATDELAEAHQDTAAMADELAYAQHQLAALQASHRELLQRLAIAERHEHRYPWPDPAGPVLPCECGKGYPPYVQPEPPDEPAGRDDGWAQLFAQVRMELKELGWGEDAA